MSAREMDEMEEYDAVQRLARSLGFFAQLHRQYDPCRRRPDGSLCGPWYLQRSKKQNPNAAPHEPTILKYATADEIFAWLHEHQKQDGAHGV
jgi:hypothetical protein